MAKWPISSGVRERPSSSRLPKPCRDSAPPFAASTRPPGLVDAAYAGRAAVGHPLRTSLTHRREPTHRIRGRDVVRPKVCPGLPLRRRCHPPGGTLQPVTSLAACSGGIRDHPGPLPVRLVHVSGSQERAHLRNVARDRGHILRAGVVGVASADCRQWMVGVGARASPVVSGNRCPHSRRHDALHPGPDLLRVGDRADADARRRHVVPAATQRRGHPADGPRR